MKALQPKRNSCVFLLQTIFRAAYRLAVGAGQTDFPETFAVHLRSGANPELHFIILADKILYQSFAKSFIMITLL